jgi:hypothetical protein
LATQEIVPNNFNVNNVLNSLIASGVLPNKLVLKEICMVLWMISVMIINLLYVGWKVVMQMLVVKIVLPNWTASGI